MKWINKGGFYVREEITPIIIYSWHFASADSLQFSRQFSFTDKRPQPGLYGSSPNRGCTADPGSCRDTHHTAQLDLNRGHLCNHYSSTANQHSLTADEYTLTNQHADTTDCNTRPRPLRPGAIC
jgi:hypothetical protein